MPLLSIYLTANSRECCSRVKICLTLISVSFLTILSGTPLYGATQNVPVQVAQAGHGDDDISIVLTQDNRKAVSVDIGGTAILWDLSSGRIVRRFETIGSDAIALSPIAHTVAICEGDRTGLWSLLTGQMLWEITSQGDGIEMLGCSDLAFAQGGASIFIARRASGLLVRASDGQVLRSFQVPTINSIQRRLFDHVAISPNGQLALTGGADGVALWSIEHAQIIHMMEREGARSLAFSHDGRLVVAGNIDEASIWNVQTGHLLRKFSRERYGVISQIKFSGDDAALLAANAIEGIAWVWDIKTGAELRRFESGGGTLSNTPTFSSDGRLVIIQPRDSKTVFELRDAQSGQGLKSIKSAREPIRADALSPDGRFVALAFGLTVVIFDLETGVQLPNTIEHDNPVNFVQFDQGGQRLLTESGDETLTVWELNGAGKLKLNRPLLPHDDEGIFDVPESESLHQNGAIFPRQTRAAVFSGNGQLLVTREDNFVRVWDLRKGAQQGRLRVKNDDRIAISIRPDNSILLGVGEKITLLEAKSYLPLGLKRYEGSTILALSPSGRLAVIGGPEEDTATLIDVTTGAKIWSVPAIGSAINAIISPDERFLLVGSGTPELSLWDLSTRKSVFQTVGVLFEEMTFSWPKLLVLGGDSEGENAVLIDARTMRELVTIGIQGRRSWLINTPEGYFDTTDLEGLNGMSWVFDDNPLTPLGPEVFMRDYYEPRLIPRLLACRRAQANKSDACENAFAKVRPLAALNRVQPVVRILKVTRRGDEALVDVEVSRGEDATQPNGKTRTEVFDLRLFRDGQLVKRLPEGPDGEDELGAWQARTRITMPVGQSSLRHTFTVALPTGRKDPVTFTAYAFNEDRVKSATATADPLPPADGPSRPRRAYVVTIGVNGYEAASRNLGFAVRDAETMREALARIEGYEVVPVTLTSEADKGTWRATKTNIEEVFTRFAGGKADLGRLVGVENAGRLAKATPDDLVIVSFSGHGHTDAKGGFYLLASDAKGAGGAAITPDILDSYISSEELSAWLRPIDAGQMALIIDACHSAASVEQPGFKPGPMGDRGLGQLAYDKAMRILAASQADDVALESNNIQQGLLTYALVRDGLAETTGPEPRRKADLDGNGALTLTEWLRYAELRTPGLYEDIRAGKVTASYIGDQPAWTPKDPIIDTTFGAQVARRAQTPTLFNYAKRDHSDAVLP